MKIAISSTGKELDSQLDARFGRCPYFVIVEVKGKEINKMKTIKNSAATQASGAGIFAAELVGNEKVDAVITGNIGPKAFGVLSQLKIEIFQTKGKVKDAVQAFIDKKLTKVKAPTGPVYMGRSRGAGRGLGRGMGRRRVSRVK